MKRKEFIKSACVMCGFGLAGAMTLLESCKKSSSNNTPQGPTVNFNIDLTQPAYTSLASVGGSVAMNGVVVAHTTGTTYIAVAQACTHQGCNIAYNSAATNFACPCHGATFDTNGNATSGPTSIPVKKYTVTKNGNILNVAG